MTAGLWKLNDNAKSLTDAAEGWKTASEVMNTASSAFLRIKNSLNDWEGASGESFHQHASKIAQDIDEASKVASNIVSTLGAVLDSTKKAQGELDASFAKISHITHSDEAFFATNAADIALVRKEMEAATDIRSALGAELAKHCDSLKDSSGKWNDLTSRAAAEARGGASSFMGYNPLNIFGEKEGETGIILINGKAIVTPGEGDNKIDVSIDPQTGEQIVTIDGAAYRIPAGHQLTIRAGSGNDIISVPSDATVGVNVVGGTGDDRITGGGGNDRIFGGWGDDQVQAGGGHDIVSGGDNNDYIDGQDGDDRVFGGKDNDTLYGLNGSDRLSGGDGRDYLEGGADKDALYGQGDKDILSGGRDDDRIFGGAGDDVAYGGRGKDAVVGGSGNDTGYDDSSSARSESERNVTIEIPNNTEYVKIEGSPDFVARVRADLDMLDSSPAGQQLTEKIPGDQDTSGFFNSFRDSLTIKEIPPEGSQEHNKSMAHDGGWMGRYEVDYQATADFKGAPPVVVLDHELAHVYDFSNSTDIPGKYNGVSEVDREVNILERQAVGLPIDHDGSPDTPEIIDPNHPIQCTENGLREEMGLPKRESYN